MTLTKSLQELILDRQPEFPSLATLQVIVAGETEDITPPFIGMMEASSKPFEQGEVIMRGVSTYEVACEFQTVPAEDEQEGTSPEDERTMRTDLYDILGDVAAIEWINGRNYWQVFDIQLSGPTTEAGDGRRITRFSLEIVACPL